MLLIGPANVLLICIAGCFAVSCIQLHCTAIAVPNLPALFHVCSFKEPHATRIPVIIYPPPPPRKKVVLTLVHSTVDIFSRRTAF
jgi:hypothetical protein